MDIIKTNRDMSGRELYHMTTSANIHKMQEAKGSVLVVEDWCRYDDVNSKGENQELLSIKTDDGTVFATNSKTFAEEFLKINDILGGNLKGEGIAVVTGVSKAGREFLTCALAD